VRDVYPVITIDGFSATGKTTLAALLSQRLGWPILLSGMLYRYCAWRVIESGVTSDAMPFLLSSKRLDDLAALDFSRTETGDVSVLADGRDITSALRAESVSLRASELAKDQRLRQALLKVQRDYSTSKGLIAEGRDMASTVFPHALLQVYLTAAAEVRSSRRHFQLQSEGFCAKIQAVSHDLLLRDKNDEARTLASRREMPCSLVIDTTDKSAQEVLALVLGDSRISAILGF